MAQASISLGEPELVLLLFGPNDQHHRSICDRLDVTITDRQGELRVAGQATAVAQATEALVRLKDQAQRRGALAPDDVAQVLDEVTGQSTPPTPSIDVIHPGQQIKPRSPGQQRYIQAIRGNDLVFAVGPAGTGKTYLAVALAVEALKQQSIRKIVLVRPAVEAGESLGFLPGDLQAKINPYLRPLMDALHEMIDHDQIQRHIETDVIEIVPLAYMRGRTLNEAFIILDEGQNTTIAQMKMFLTRMGERSKIVVSGDPTQVDLPRNTPSGLADALERLKKIKGIETVQLTKADIVRHKLVQEIVDAYHEPSKHSGGRKNRRK